MNSLVISLIGDSLENVPEDEDSESSVFGEHTLTRDTGFTTVMLASNVKIG